MMNALLVAFAGAVVPIGDDVTSRRVELSDGSVVRASFRTTEEGAVLLDGTFTRVTELGEELVAGEFKDGLKHGRWDYRHETGELRAAGTYVRGKRVRKWKFYRPDGEPLAEGQYRSGVRTGRWSVWNDDGTPNETESGEYELVEGRSAETGAFHRGYTLDGRLHGPWTFWWANGQKQLEAEFAKGERAGTWRFWHLDGTYDPQMTSGEYDPGPDIPALDAEPTDADRWAELSELLGVSSPIVVVQDREPESVSLPAPTEEDQRILARTKDWRQLDSAERQELLGVLFRALARTEAHDVRPRGLYESGGPPIGALETICGNVFGWRLKPGHRDSTDADIAASWLAVQRGASFCALTLHLGEFWNLDMRIDRRRGGDRLVRTLMHPPFERGFMSAGDELLKQSFFGCRLRDKKLRAREGSSPELRAALTWLVQHQSPEGGWDGANFMKRCGRIGSNVCEDPGEEHYDVGVTGLALLALLGDGNTTSRGPHRAAVTRGIAWLILKQDPTTGEIGGGGVSVPQHGIATTALAEAAAASENPRIRVATRRAVDFIQRARNPHGAWHYDEIHRGENVTTSTGWQLMALTTAERAGFDVDPAAIEGGLKWINEMSDPANGRIGYDHMGSRSSRVVGINDHFPPKKAEALTAVGLLSRFLIGQTPNEHPIMGKHADLIAKTLPEWDPENYGCDMYYWFHGSQAMFQMNDKRGRAWQKAVTKVATESQRQDGDMKGSWDPAGPWGHFGGRVYSTALMALTLETPQRYPQLWTPKKRGRSARTR